MKFPKFGPAFLVTAAFIGPGTVVTASLAGANYGYALLWALLFSTVATMVLQEMSARLGIITQQGLGENIRSQLSSPFMRNIGILLVISAIVIGNGAYEGGNISAASLGVSAIVSALPANIWPILIGIIAFLVLWTGSYKVIEKALITLVALMSFTFVITMILTKPDITSLLTGLLSPKIPAGATLTVIALIGTTVVPYNLFLHASTVHEKWKSEKHLLDARKDLYISVPLGGLISIAILSTGATAFFGSQVSISSAADLAPSLEPLFGPSAGILMAMGLFAAGISSTITAPLATAYALWGVLGYSTQSGVSVLSDIKFKFIWMTILILGIVIASSGYRPISIIWFAQVANGILLPIITIFLLWIMNTNVLGQYKNSLTQNIVGGAVFLVTLLLSGRSLMSAFSLL